jgi:hypothetical protein
MSKVSAILAVSMAAAVAAGCATITKGTTQQVALSTPGAPGAQGTLTSSAIGTKVVQTPATLTLDKGADNVAVICRKECFQDSTGIIATHTEAMAAGNIIADGVIGLGIDAASGAMNRYNADNQIALVPIQGCRARA